MLAERDEHQPPAQRFEASGRKFPREENHGACRNEKGGRWSMRKKALWIVAAIVVLLGVVFWFWQFYTPPPYEPLTIQRQSLGRFPTVPREALDVQASCLSDLDSNGEPEVIALYVDWRKGGMPHSALWHNLHGEPERMPLFVLSPSVSHTDLKKPIPPSQQGNLPLPRELIGWNVKTGQIALLTRADERWQMRPIPPLQTEQIRDAAWSDLDMDGRLDDALLMTQSGRYAWLELDASGRWQLRSITTKPPTSHAALPFLTGVGLGAFAYLRSSGTTVVTQSLPDIDGDGRPERIVPAMPRRLETSRTKQRLPIGNGEPILLEMDGQPGSEVLVVEHTPLPPSATPPLRLTLYQVREGAFRHLASWSAPVGLTAHLWLKDIDRDGRTEVIIADFTGQTRANQTWHVVRFENEQFQQNSFTIALPEALSNFSSSVVEFPNGVAYTRTGQKESLLRKLAGRAARNVYSVLAGFSEPASTDPSRWNMLVLKDREILWAGDYDGDGAGEIVLGAGFSNEGVWLMQYRANRWQGAQVSYRGRVVAVLPARLNGQPQLILVYHDGLVEAIAIQNQSTTSRAGSP